MEIQRIDHTDAGRVLQGYALLQEAMGADSVEDMGSFLETISPYTDPAVAPRLVGAFHQDELVGLIVGAYLQNLNMGFIAYSGVKEVWRGRGIYRAMREELIDLFNGDWGLGTGEQGTGTREPPIPVPQSLIPRQRQVSYIISELDENGWLYSKYVYQWHGYALPCAYEQPAAQGLPARPLKLVLQPTLPEPTPPNLPFPRGGTSDIPAPTGEIVAAIVREIYERVYRITDATSNPSYCHILASIGEGRKSVPQRVAT